MLRTIILIAVSAISLGISSCATQVKKIDAYQCVLILVDQQGNKRPVEQWYWRCVNQKLNQSKNISIFDSDKCIRDGVPCKFYGTDVMEIERVKKWYNENAQCPTY